jgi:hypothetical protein
MRVGLELDATIIQVEQNPDYSLSLGIADGCHTPCPEADVLFGLDTKETELTGGSFLEQREGWLNALGWIERQKRSAAGNGLPIRPHNARRTRRIRPYDPLPWIDATFSSRGLKAE